MTRSFISQSVFSLTFLRYMKDFCTVYRKHTSSLSYLNTSVDKEKVLATQCLSFDQGGNFEAILTDFLKTFNYLCHDLLIAKFHAYGLDRSPLKLFPLVLNKKEEKCQNK